MRLLLLLLLALSVILAREIINPFVVLPPFLRFGTTNTIIVTPIKTNSDNVDISLTVSAVSGSRKSPIYTQKFKAKRAGASHSFDFQITSSSDLAEIHIQVSKHADFVSEIRIRPDVGAIHLHTSKNIYRAGETVETRILPLTSGGAIYTGPLDVALVNPDGYELTRHRVVASDGFLSMDFELPLHLFFGDWRIVARASGYRDSDMSYETQFAVRDYELPPFQLRLIVGEDDPLNRTSFTVEASYFYGAPIDGTLVFYCSPYSKNQTSRTHRLLQTEV